MEKYKDHIHFIGIGGIGMSALARLYVAKGHTVSGSDISGSDITGALQAEGMKVYIRHDAGNVTDADRVVYSAAVLAHNPEMVAAKKKHIPIFSYAEAIGELTKVYKTIAVSGTHGKSTTTAMLGLILIKAGLDPTIIVGTRLRELGDKNMRAGKSEYLVLEADEYARSFHEYHPYIAVLTNVEADHLDIYKTLAGVKTGFRTYLKRVVPGGYIVANGGDAGVRDVVRGAKVKIVWYNKKSFPNHTLRVPGRFNQVNAEAAWQAAHLLGVKKSVAETALYAYKGAWRRLEQITKGIYSDYAHHPTEIAATLGALREAHPQKHITAVFQPHQQDRLNRLFSQFTKAFISADRVIIMPIYAVAGREVPEEKTSEDLAHAIKKEYVYYAKNFLDVQNIINEEKKKTSLVIYMSAGDLDAEVRAYYQKK
ncbi:MAG: UDP-N-acetylmuramate--L-alanine ligase [Candidatus Ryanbacteria bacterium CG10_big_fil_rev_8_21_14_0_10_43_42]|uniref:UDP-N-acetylmuramate--L-alanine ligase n=1 Tax=Candidatus Ryanbacteria bacterium CG10_big_fil_rev_8_21_14_0_10_43_42 TaxID=1974864 RepID=A0A2M8KVZ0_9BACT|nr:MAG: UDP-N-acetylmuramate--L-alanine ligase [Candidatus Ryanbacteria bacterium CG10_big_fil_rev_8_21_14_0_10_43_42]